jgi:TP901 family phage tail tape measure protein
MTALNNLLFKVSLLDAMSGPAKNMMSTMDRVTSNIQGGFNKIGYGAAGLIGSAYSLDAVLRPAKDMQTSLGEVKSLLLGTADGGKQVLENLNSTALKFTSQYGGSAAEFVKSSYDIQSAISGLSGNELPAFTNASAILAKATKADMGVITNYVGTMYQVFQGQADAMGKANWINQMAGQTATAVNIFKVEGQGMADAFANLGTNAAGAGIAMNEQMAVLGTLTSSMKGGAEAGTAYRSFLDKVVKSQKDLGLNFLDSQNHMLPMVDILTKIKGKYGDLSDQTKKSIVSKAFGESPEAMGVITRLIGNIDGLQSSITQVGDKSGWQSAIDMANAMTQPWDRASASVENLRIVIGQKMLVVLDPVYNKITAVSQTLLRWSELFPNITRYIGYAVFGIIGITAALSALSVIVGIGTLVMGGFGLVLAVITSPITLAVLGIAALGAAIGAAIYKWDEWGGAIMYVGQAITDAFGVTWLLQQFWNGLTGIYNGWSMIFTIIYNNAGPILSFIGDVVVAVGQIIDILGHALGFGPILDWVKNLFDLIISGWKMIAQLVLPDWMQKLIPGVSAKIDVTQPQAITSPAAQPSVLDKLATPSTVTGATAAPSLSAMAAQPKWMQQPAPGLLTDGFAPPQPIAAPAALTQSGTANVPRGGLMSQINNADNSKVVNVGGITIHNPSNPVGPLLADELQMAAG